MEVVSASPVLNLERLTFRSKKRARELYLENRGEKAEDSTSLKLKIAAKIHDEYAKVKDLAPVQASTAVVSNTRSVSSPASFVATDQHPVTTLGSFAYPSRPGVTISDEELQSHAAEEEDLAASSATQEILRSLPGAKPSPRSSSNINQSIVAIQNSAGLPERIQPPSNALAIKNPYAFEKPTWHAPWKLMRVISGHLGWVRSVAVDPANEWFATGSADRTIKIWDLASGTLKLTLTGHINTVRGLVVSNRHPYLFSCAEDKMIKCWDLEQNKVVRHYHGHLSGVYCIALHPTIDVIVTGGRDSTARVWDIRTKNNIHVLAGHTSTVASVACQSTDPQVISGSHDSTIRLWDLAKGGCYASLTHHKKSVRSMVLHPTEYTMASAAPDNIKIWKFPEGRFMRNLSGHNSIVNTVAINSDNVLVSGADNGSMYFWDWKSGYNFQRIQATVQPGSLDSEAGIYALTFDQTGSRLISCEADKTIKIYKEDETQTEETFPIEEDWRKQQEEPERRKKNRRSKKKHV